MQEQYRKISLEEVRNVLDFCRLNATTKGGRFEVYSTPGADVHMVVVNRITDNHEVESMVPEGVFYLNKEAPGVISIEEDDLNNDSMPQAKDHIDAIKKTIDLLIRRSKSEKI